MEQISREEAQDMARTILGRKRYLNGIEGKLYWSDYQDTDDHDDPGGKALWNTAMDAIIGVIQITGMLRRPNTGNPDYVKKIVRELKARMPDMLLVVESEVE